MKKILFFCLFSFFVSPFFFAQSSEPLLPEIIYTDDAPGLLKGIWQGDDRLVLFSGTDGDFSCVLRVFYKWYDDRASEPPEYAQITSRDRNDASSKSAEHIQIKYGTLFENAEKSAGAYELAVKYPGNAETVFIPLCVIGGKLYLDFYLRIDVFSGEDEYQDENVQAHPYFLLKRGISSGIKIIPPVQEEDFFSYLVDGNAFFQIRYWISDMEYSSDFAEFSAGGKTYSVHKHVFAAGKIFTCVTGRSKKIRNVRKIDALPAFVSDDEQVIFAHPNSYLVYVPGSGEAEELFDIVKKDNSKKAPPQKPPFSPEKIDFHWKEISELEKYNPYTWNRRNIDIHK